MLILWSAAVEKGYIAPVWTTCRQASELKAQVRKGGHGSLVVYADRMIRTETDAATGEEIEQAIPFLKDYTVFNVAQIDGLPEHYYNRPAPRAETIERIERAETFFAATGATIRHGGSMDFVQMPPFESFRDAESYYATLAHECTHWTRHQIRLDRDFGRKRFGDEGYVMDELVGAMLRARKSELRKFMQDQDLRHSGPRRFTSRSKLGKSCDLAAAQISEERAGCTQAGIKTGAVDGELASLGELEAERLRLTTQLERDREALFNLRVLPQYRGDRRTGERAHDRNPQSRQR